MLVIALKTTVWFSGCIQVDCFHLKVTEPSTGVQSSLISYAANEPFSNLNYVNLARFLERLHWPVLALRLSH